MYCEFFGFSERPFEPGSDTKVLFLNTEREAALSSLIGAIRDRVSPVALIGEEGVGKATLFQAAVDRLVESVKVARIVKAEITFVEMLTSVLVELGAAEPGEPLTDDEVLDRLEEFARRELNRNGHVVFFLRNGQDLDNAGLLNLKALSDVEIEGQKLIQVVLSGGPGLESKVRPSATEEITLPVDVILHVPALNEKDTRYYILHRLAAVNYDGPTLFSNESIRSIWKYSRGLPQRINQLCDNALLVGYGMGQKIVNAEVVREAIDDLNWRPFSGTFDGPIPAAFDEQDEAEDRSLGEAPPLFGIPGKLSAFKALVFQNGRRAIQGATVIASRVGMQTTDLMDRMVQWGRRENFGRRRNALVAGLGLVVCLFFALWVFVGGSRTDLGDQQSASQPKSATMAQLDVKEAVKEKSGAATSGPESNESGRDTEPLGAMDKKGSEKGPSARSEGQSTKDLQALAPEGSRGPGEKQTPGVAEGYKEASPERRPSQQSESKEPKTASIGPTTEPAKAGNLVIQLGAFWEMGAAKRFEQKIADKGYQTYVDEKKVKGNRTLYRVRVCCFSEMTQAKKVKVQLKKQGFADSLIVKVK